VKWRMPRTNKGRWAQVSRLNLYKLSGRLVEPHKDVQVELVILDRTGKQQHRKATYQVLLVPNPTVVRND
jgi:hypothetical protein